MFDCSICAWLRGRSYSPIRFEQQMNSIKYELVTRARRGDLGGVKRLIEEDVHVNTKNHHNQTALYCACEHGHTDVAQYLLDNGASLDLGEEKPLIAAVRYNHYDCTKLLLQHNADVNCTNRNLETPMSVALQKRHYSIILLLLQHNAIPSASLGDDVAFRLLKLAEVEHTKTIQKLIDDKIINLRSEITFLAAFIFAFERGSVELAERMLLNYNYPKIEQLYPYAAYYSAKNNWLSVLSNLFEKGVDINVTTNDQSPLYAACKEGHESVVTLLLNSGADPNVSFPLQVAVQQRNAAIFNMLLEKGAKMDMLGEPLLHIVCSEASALKTADKTRSVKLTLSIICQILQQGVNVNAISEMGDTALFRACESGHLQVVQVLLEAGADVNLTSTARYPLIGACEAGNPKLVNVLVEAGADVKCSNGNNETCLHAFINSYANATCVQKPVGCFSNSDIKNTVRLLLESGVDVNAHCFLGETALYRASKAELEDIVRLLLQAGADTTGSTSRRPLYAACERGHVQIVDLLLQHGADPNAPTGSDSRSLPILCAVMKGYTDIVDLLLKYGADANKQDQLGRSVLICFIELLASQTCKTSHVVEPLNERNLSILKSMLFAGGDVNGSDLDGRSALHVASSFGMCDVIMELLEHGANCNHLTYRVISAIYLACKNGHEAAVEMLLKNGGKPDRETATTYCQVSYNSQESVMPVLCMASEKGSETMVKLLLQYGADVNASDEKGNTALHLATSHSVAEILLNAGAKVNARNNNGDTPLGVVCKKRQADASVVEMLVKFGADLDRDFLLHAACKNNDVDTVQLLLAYGTDANQVKLVPRRSWTYRLRMVSMEPSPLCIACKNGNMAMLGCLLRNGADVTFADNTGNSLLHFAVQRLEEKVNLDEYDPVITLLLQHNAPVNMVSSIGETPLYMACMKGLPGVVKQLLDCGADIGLTKSDSNKYPLLIACQKTFRDIAMMLLERGADANVNRDCLTPLKLAAANGDVVLVNQLITYGADLNQMKNIGDTALHSAIRQSKCSNEVNIVRRAEINVPLCLACCASDAVNVDVVKTLLEHGADPNIICPPSSDWSPSSWYQSLPLLSVAASCGNSELVLLLIKFGAKLDLSDEFGGTALHFAIGYGEMSFYDGLRCPRHLDSINLDTSTAEILLSAGAEVNVLDTTGISPLLLTCSRGRTKFVKLLLSRGANPNYGIKDKLPIHAACRGLHYESAKLLLEYKSDVTACDESGKTALHHVLESIMCRPNPDNDKNAALVQLLLEAGASVNAACENGKSPIHVVCSHGLTLIAKKMLEYGTVADVNSGKKLPLITACKRKHMPLVQLLLTHGFDPNIPEEGNVALHVAAIRDNSELTELLLKHGANVDVANTDGNTALHLAIGSYCPTASLFFRPFICEKFTIDILLENKADINKLNVLGETPLYRAVARELLDVVRKMLHVYGGNPNTGSPDKSPLVAACQKENVELVDMLLSHGADPNLHETSASCDLASNHKLPLFVAADAPNTDIITSLLNAGASVNATNQEGRNAVCFAAENLTIARYYPPETKRILSAIRLLLQHGANFSMLLPDGYSPLHLLLGVLSVLRRGDRYKTCLSELLQLMVEHGAMLLDSSSQLESIISGQCSSTRTLADLATFDGKHKFIVDLFRAGAGFELIASCCRGVRTSRTAKSIALCQAVVLAGYVPRAEELVKLRLAAIKERTADGLLMQLTDWFIEDRQHVPSLFRQCRAAIRRQLSTLTQYRTILPAIEQLPLPNDVKLYLQFDGQMTEVDLGVENVKQQPQSGEATDSDDTSVESPYSSEQSDYENDSDSDFNYDFDNDYDVNGSDYYNISDSD